MAFIDQSDSIDSFSSVKGNLALISSRMSYITLVAGIATLSTTLLFMKGGNLRFTGFIGFISMIGIYTYLIYSSILILIIGFLFKNSYSSDETNKVNNTQTLLLILLMILLVTIFPVLNKISSISSSFLILEILYGLPTLFLFISVIKNIVLSKN